MAKGFLDDVADKLGVDETLECDNVLKWDGTQLYVEQRVLRAGRQSRIERRDVTREVAAHISRFLR